MTTEPMTPEEQIGPAFNETDERTRWKYITLHGIEDRELQSQLSFWGRFGWELAAMQPDKRNNTFANSFIVVMKCPYWLEQPPEPSDE